MKLAADAITISAGLQEDWLKARRDDVKNSLPDDFKRLSTVEVPLTAKNLFGDDLEGSIKTVENTNKIANKMETKKNKTSTKSAKEKEKIHDLRQKGKQQQFQLEEGLQ